MIVDKSRIESIISIFVTVYPHETSALIYSTSSFFFILSAYFVVLPLRDEGAISLGLGKLPGLFVGSLLLTLVAAPVSTLIFSLPNLSKGKSGSRLFGFVGAGATLGQLFGSLFATGMAWLGPYLLLFAALLLEFAAQTSKGIIKDISQHPEELTPIRKADNINKTNEQSELAQRTASPRTSSSMEKPQMWAILEGLQLILSSTYLLQVALFLWLSAVVSSFFYFQKVTVIASTVASPVGRRRLFAEINSFIAVFILGGQLTLTGRILTTAGVTIAICSAPFFGFINLIALAALPSWSTVAITETLRKVVMYVVARPGRELLFTVVTKDEKYKAKVCLDVIVQRLGDAAAAGMYKLLFSTLNGNVSNVPLYALPDAGKLNLPSSEHLNDRILNQDDVL
ncbi:hypothetical protein Sango_2649100 [Sesamum angolense]|uniref:Uncharacterized protein n=1 Tax=Sesamum angolense TaxID=2727404 RepID=A0AAE2BH59_9LAMI|nr:hypothetical protein Sango_2649100 [Sesamum angolense]